MAAKKRPSKSASPRRTKARPMSMAAPAPLPPLPPPAPKRPYGVIVLGLAVVLGLVCWALAHRSADQAPAEVSVPATPVPAPVAAATVAPAPTDVPTAVPEAEAAPRHHEDRGKVLAFSLSSGKPLTLKCWRSAGGVASLDIFGQRNTRVFTVSSEPGAEGWLDLSWDGHDAQGALVAPGRYYALPSQKAASLILALKVKN